MGQESALSLPLSVSLSLRVTLLESMLIISLSMFVCACACSVRYKRYKLGDLKDFDSLFFPEKGNLLKILANFEEKKGTCKR